MSEASDFMTDDQREALNKAGQILGEHFDANVIVVGWQSLEADGQSYNTAGNWDGGIPTAIGLCEIYRRKLLNLHLGTIDEDQP